MELILIDFESVGSEVLFHGKKMINDVAYNS